MDNYQFVNFGEGFGSTSTSEVDALNKALEAGTGYTGAPTSLTGGGVMQVESLDSSLKSVTFEMKNIKMWPILAKDQAYNTIEEYNRIDAFGDQGRGFISEGALPRSQDASYSRQIQRIRFIGVTRELTHVYTLVRNAHGDAIASQIRNGTMRILEIIERNIADGRGHYVTSAGLVTGADAAILDADTAWEGLDKQIRKGDTDASATSTAFTGYGAAESVVRDVRGAILDEDDLEEAGRIVTDNHGVPSIMLMDTKVHSDLSKQFYPKERVNSMGVSNGTAGFVLQSFASSAGVFSLMGNVFLKPKRTLFGAVVGAPSAPASATVTNEGADANSSWTAAEAGTYAYLCTAINEAGESVACASSAGVAVTAGDKMKIICAATATAFAYAVYRSTKNTVLAHEFVGYIAPASVGAAATMYDLNKKLPGLSQAYLLTNDAEVIRMKQLAPLMKMDLAIVATAYRWMQLFYGALVLYAPRKNVLLSNIGRSA